MGGSGTSYLFGRLVGSKGNQLNEIQKKKKKEGRRKKKEERRKKKEERRTYLVDCRDESVVSLTPDTTTGIGICTTSE